MSNKILDQQAEMQKIYNALPGIHNFLPTEVIIEDQQQELFNIKRELFNIKREFFIHKICISLLVLGLAIILTKLL